LKPGMRFGNYTILKFHSKSDTRKLGMWESKCDCGNIVFKRTAAFTTEKTIKCQRCSNKENTQTNIKPNKQSCKNKICAHTRNAARCRGLVFELTDAEILHLTSLPCFYCDSPHSNLTRTKRGDCIQHNGLDRVDNNKGYTIDNVVPCCRYCNFAKMDTDLKEWIFRIERIYNNLDKIIERSETISEESTTQVSGKQETSQEDEDIVQTMQECIAVINDDIEVTTLCE